MSVLLGLSDLIIFLVLFFLIFIYLLVKHIYHALIKKIKINFLGYKYYNATRITSFGQCPEYYRFFKSDDEAIEFAKNEKCDMLCMIEPDYKKIK